MFSHACYRFHVFPRLLLFHVFPRLLPVSCFPALATVSCFPELAIGFMFSRVCLIPVLCFPALATGLYFPALATGFMISRACYGFMFSCACPRFHLFSRLLSVFMFSRVCLVPVLCFPALDNGFIYNGLFCGLYLIVWLSAITNVPLKPWHLPPHRSQTQISGYQTVVTPPGDDR